MGIPGDEDGGGMSAFVVFSYLGFYPVSPGIPVYTIGSPIFTRASIRMDHGRTFTVEARNSSRSNKYIQSATLNGRPLNRTWFTHEDLIKGGTLILVMGDRPNYRWGIESPPPSAEDLQGR
jgi:putative alpha-1,2-mannosidase